MKANDNDRLLFIGFGKLLGYECFDWSDDTWLNAADYSTVLINNLSLDIYIEQRVSLHIENEDRRPDDYNAIKLLAEKLERLKTELVKVLFTGRQIYAFATAEKEKRISLSQYVHTYIENYSWSPFAFNTVSHEGEARNVRCDPFADYAVQIKRWTFTFTVRGDIDHLRGYAGVEELPSNDEYKVYQNSLVTNYSDEPFCVAIECVRLRRHKPIWTSGSLTLLHYQQVGNIIDALNSVLKTFTTATVSVDSAPSWIGTVKLSAAKDIDGEIQTIEAEMDNLTSRLFDLRTKRKYFEKWLTLLYATGEELELVVADALTLLGIDTVKRGPKGDWDLSFGYNGLKFIVEVKGLTKGLGRKHVFDLDRHMGEYEVKTGAAADKGILIFCPFRDVPPTDRNPQIWAAGDAINFAEQLEFSLVSTVTLFEMVSAHLTGGGEEVGQDVKRLLNKRGLFTKDPF